jgi:ATP synthase in type III secretion protein N
MTNPIGKIRSDLLARAANPSTRPLGIVRQVRGLTVRAVLDEARIGDMCLLRNTDGSELPAEIVGIEGDEAILSPFADLRGVSTLTQVVSLLKPLTVNVGDHLLGHVTDAFGRVEGITPSADSEQRPVTCLPPVALKRQLVREPFETGVRAIDAMLTVGAGQRVGIFGGAGLGKSTLVSMLINQSRFHKAVIALVGERGREIREMYDAHLLPAVRERTVLVASTSDRPAIERRLAANTAMTIAEGFRDRGENVLLIIDSLTRFARAQREVGLAAGEPPVRRGYPPSVASMLAELLERAGPGETGSITAFFTVLVEGDIDDDPIAEEVKALLDGHVILSRKLSEEGHFPAIDVLASRSRLMPSVTDRNHRKAADRIRALLAKYREIELLLQIGEYRPGSDAIADEAIAKAQAMKAFLRQDEDDWATLDTAREQLTALAFGDE